MQASPNLDHRRASASSREVLSTIIRERGTLALWRGLTPTLAYVIPSNLVFFSIYEYNRNKKDPNWIAASKARAIACTLLSPVEFIRTRVQATIAATDQTPIQVIRRVFYEDSFASYWRGLTPTLLRDVPFSAMYFALYEFNKKWMLPKHAEKRDTLAMGSRKERINLAESQVLDEQSSKFVFGSEYADTLLLTIANGATCGLIASVLTHPFDIVKTQLQSCQRAKSVNNYRVYTIHNTFDGMKLLRKEYGLRWMTIGLTPRLLKVVPGSAVMLASYEMVHAVMNDLTLEETRRTAMYNANRRKLTTTSSPVTDLG
jgi:solute carrier family 25, member 39/40